MSRGDSFIFRNPCGCAFGLQDVTAQVDTPSKAWKAMFTAKERDAAVDRGVTVTREPWEDYRHTVYAQLTGPCPHAAVTA
jgi:hypothetical protein